MTSIIAWTCIINIYFPIYDSILIVISVLAFLNASTKIGMDLHMILGGKLSAILILCYSLPWVTCLIAKNYGIQIFTISLISYAIYIDTQIAQHVRRNK